METSQFSLLMATIIVAPFMHPYVATGLAIIWLVTAITAAINE
jgi:hypothetical protein